MDALAANRREPRGGSLASLFEQPLFDRKSLQGSNRLQLDWLADVDAATRLLYVRLALMVLAEPPDPAEEADEPLGRSWLLNQYRHSRISGWQSVFAHAIRDPLFLLVTELPRTMVLELMRSASRTVGVRKSRKRGTAWQQIQGGLRLAAIGVRDRCQGHEAGLSFPSNA
ncbi:hypothetical protein [Caulobacter sp. RL271]|uniref:Uncharacterized protein n=1 Tax=Caulobacter segnis TaxID=88688 RepID=A0ABY5A2G0_9CAUL|nr:hypothetical protein [Caulobacter segnis]USQ98442.1 hypothetical protein MZV50_13220 [Caulobacter segnis]